MQSLTRSGWLALPLAVGLFAVAPPAPTGRAAPPPVSAAPTSSRPSGLDPTFDRTVKPFLATYCNSCHNSKKQAGGVALDVYLSEAHAKKDRKGWADVERVVTSGEMPPKNKPQPAAAERDAVLAWVSNTALKADCFAQKDPGRVTLRRLNRAEYNNTVRDLCGVDYKPAEDFPSDDVGYGFDNIGDVLSVQPILLEKYLAAADKVLEQALPSLARIPSAKQRYGAQNILVTPRSAKSGVNGQKITLTTDGAAYLEKFDFPATGEYVVRVRAWGLAEGGTAPTLAVRVGGKDVKTFPVTAAEGKAQAYEARLTVEHGDRRVAAALVNPSDAKAAKPRALGVEAIEVEGPVGGAERPIPPSVKLVLAAIPKADADAREAARASLTDFVRRAYRRPAKPEEVTRLMRLFDLAMGRGERFEDAIKLPLKAVLASPHFLFRVEADPADPAGVRTINDYEFATRLSYFLWSTMPDEDLFAAAARGDLRQLAVLKAQIARMLKDPKSAALVENFAGQWLQLRNLRTLAPDPGTYKGWDESLRAAMIRESELFFENIVKADRSVLEFLDADYTFVNGRLARHYGIPGVSGPDFKQVKLTDRRRGGIVTQASVLTVTSNPTRTSPVKRGKWILENVLGTPPPPPAPDVPELPPAEKLTGTLRQQMEQHRANPSCATCHAKLDPLGFGLENFDGVGGWRDRDNKQPVDATGVLPDGATFNGPGELRTVLLGKADQFRRCLSEKLLTYAVGRGLEYYDKCVVDEIAGKLTAGQDHFSALVLAIAESDAFQKRKGQRSE